MSGIEAKTGNISKSKGFKGDTGAAGPSGPQGPQGEKGQKGDTPSIVLRYDQESGNLYYNSDGILVDKEYVETQNLATKDYVDGVVANGGGGSVDPDEVIKIIETEHEKHRTHYAEDILKCDYTIKIDISDLEVDASLEEQLNVHLTELIDLNKLKAYINGKRAIVEFYEGSNAGVFYVTLVDGETGDELVWFTYRNKAYDTGKPKIYFQPYSEKGTRVELYEENVVPLDANYLPESIPKMINYEDVLLCEYTYDSADFVDEYCPTVALKRIPDSEQIKYYVNGEQTYVIIEQSSGGDFYGRDFVEGKRVNYFKYWAEDGSFVFYNKDADGNQLYDDGTVVQIRQDSITALEDKDIPDSIARVQDVKEVNEKIKNNSEKTEELEDQMGDVETALDNIIAIQTSLIGGGS